MFPFTDSVYKYLKWIAAIVLPALTALVGTVGLAVGWMLTEKVVIITAAVNTFFGALVGVSSQAYGKQEALTDDGVSKPINWQPDLYHDIVALNEEKDKENEEIELVKVDDFVATGINPEKLKGGAA